MWINLWHENKWEVRNIRNREEKGKILFPFIDDAIATHYFTHNTKKQT